MLKHEVGGASPDGRQHLPPTGHVSSADFVHWSDPA